MDILGPITGEHATSYVIVLMDLYSRWVEVSCVQDISSSAVIRFLEGVFKRESFPRYLLTDNGVQFCSHETESYLQRCGIVHKKSALYHPETNGAIERVIKI